MRKLFLFMMVSLDGYMEGPDHDLSWHNVDNEFNDFAVKQMKEASTIVFGRHTYQLMENYWPTKQSLEDDPIVANLMNNTQKVIQTDVWKNVTLFRDDIAQEIKKLKSQEGKDIVVLGSNNLCVTLLEDELLDEIRLMINPVAIGKGTPLFTGIKEKIEFNLTSNRNFKNGNILLTYSTQK